MKTTFEDPTGPRKWNGPNIAGFEYVPGEIAQRRSEVMRSLLEEWWQLPWVEEEHPDHRK
jgi:hypothetical protein